jgi:uncharacterized membrane protein
MATPGGAEARDIALVQPLRVCPAGAGWSWISRGWGLFARAALMWIASLVILFIIAFAMGLVPIIGHIAFQILSPVFAAGLVLACRSVEQSGNFELSELFGGFRVQLGPLAVVGVLFLLGEIAILLVFGAFAGFAILSGALAGHTGNVLDAVVASSTSIALGALVAAALSVPLFAAYWFAPALVVLNGMAPLAAMRASFVGCMRNFVPFLVYSVIMTIFAILAALPAGLGFLVWFPLLITSTYVAYRDIYTGGMPELPPR